MAVAVAGSGRAGRARALKGLSSAGEVVVVRVLTDRHKHVRLE